MQKGSFNHSEYEELLRLKNEINEKIRDYNQNASEEELEKIKKIKDKFANTYISQKFNQIPEDMDDKQLHKHNRYYNYLNNILSIFQKDVDIDPGRLLGLTDGIFGMVMTLLIFGMALPEMELLSSGDFYNFIVSSIPTIGVTLVSFVLLASFWIYHHEFIKINNLNVPYLWLNMFFLASISFIPFTTSVVGNYSQFFLANVVFGLNIFLTNLFFMLMFVYADKMHFLEDKLSREEKKYTYNTFLIIMGLTVVINLLDFNFSRNFIYLFFLVPVISTIRDIMFRMKT